MVEDRERICEQGGRIRASGARRVAAVVERRNLSAWEKTAEVERHDIGVPGIAAEA
jgi:hypothetical protein